MSVKHSAWWLALKCFHKLSCFDFAFSPCVTVDFLLNTFMLHDLVILSWLWMWG